MIHCGTVADATGPKRRMVCPPDPEDVLAVEAYDGHGNARAWLSRLEQWSHACGWDSDICLQVACVRMTGAAQRWLDTVKLRTYDEFSSRFLERFSITQEAAMAQLFACQQQLQESTYEYAARFCMLARAAGLKEDSLLHRFISGLLPELQQEVWRKEFCDTDEIARFCEYWLSCNHMYSIDEINCYHSSRCYSHHLASDDEYDDIHDLEWLAWQDRRMYDSADSQPVDHHSAGEHTALEQLAIRFERLEHMVELHLQLQEEQKRLQQQEEEIQLLRLLLLEAQSAVQHHQPAEQQQFITSSNPDYWNQEELHMLDDPVHPGAITATPASDAMRHNETVGEEDRYQAGETAVASANPGGPTSSYVTSSPESARAPSAAAAARLIDLLAALPIEPPWQLLLPEWLLYVTPVSSEAFLLFQQVLDHSPPLVDLHDAASCSILEAILAGHARSSAWARVALLSGDTESIPEDLELCNSSEGESTTNPDAKVSTDRDSLTPDDEMAGILLMDDTVTLATSVSYRLLCAAATFNTKPRNASHTITPLVLELQVRNEVSKIKTTGLPSLRPFPMYRVWDPGIYLSHQMWEGKDSV